MFYTSNEQSKAGVSNGLSTQQPLLLNGGEGGTIPPLP